jgi:hypothetical protein
LSALRAEAEQSAAWRNTVQNAIAYQQRATLIGELESALTPPAPPPEPQIVYVEAEEGSDELGTADFNIERWGKKPRSWF